MKKPKTRQEMARRRGDPVVFNPANGEPHTRGFLDSPVNRVLHKGRRFTYATSERKATDGKCK